MLARWQEDLGRVNPKFALYAVDPDTFCPIALSWNRRRQQHRDDGGGGGGADDGAAGRCWFILRGPFADVHRFDVDKFVHRMTGSSSRLPHDKATSSVAWNLVTQMPGMICPCPVMMTTTMPKSTKVDVHYDELQGAKIPPSTTLVIARLRANGRRSRWRFNVCPWLEELRENLRQEEEEDDGGNGAVSSNSKTYAISEATARFFRDDDDGGDGGDDPMDEDADETTVTPDFAFVTLPNYGIAPQNRTWITRTLLRCGDTNVLDSSIRRNCRYEPFVSSYKRLFGARVPESIVVPVSRQDANDLDPSDAKSPKTAVSRQEDAVLDGLDRRACERAAVRLVALSLLTALPLRDCIGLHQDGIFAGNVTRATSSMVSRVLTRMRGKSDDRHAPRKDEDSGGGGDSSSSSSSSEGTAAATRKTFTYKGGAVMQAKAQIYLPPSFHHPEYHSERFVTKLSTDEDSIIELDVQSYYAAAMVVSGACVTLADSVDFPVDPDADAKTRIERFLSNPAALSSLAPIPALAWHLMRLRREAKRAGADALATVCKQLIVGTYGMLARSGNRAPSVAHPPISLLTTAVGRAINATILKELGERLPNSRAVHSVTDGFRIVLAERDRASLEEWKLDFGRRFHDVIRFNVSEDAHWRSAFVKDSTGFAALPSDDSLPCFVRGLDSRVQSMPPVLTRIYDAVLSEVLRGNGPLGVAQFIARRVSPLSAVLAPEVWETDGAAFLSKGKADAMNIGQGFDLSFASSHGVHLEGTLRTTKSMFRGWYVEGSPVAFALDAKNKADSRKPDNGPGSRMWFGFYVRRLLVDPLIARVLSFAFAKFDATLFVRHLASALEGASVDDEMALVQGIGKPLAHWNNKRNRQASSQGEGEEDHDDDDDDDDDDSDEDGSGEDVQERVASLLNRCAANADAARNARLSWTSRSPCLRCRKISSWKLPDSLRTLTGERDRTKHTCSHCKRVDPSTNVHSLQGEDAENEDALRALACELCVRIRESSSWWAKGLLDDVRRRLNVQ